MSRYVEEDDTDVTLVLAARTGQVRAFEELLGRHEERVLRVLRLMGVPLQDREDVAQDVFIRVFKHLNGFLLGRPFRSWVYRIAVNAAHDYRSRSGRRRSGEADWPEGLDAVEPGKDPQEQTEISSLRSRLLAGLGILSDRERAVFILKELEGLETREVSRALGVTSVTVRRHLGLARRRLRKFLG